MGLFPKSQYTNIAQMTNRWYIFLLCNCSVNSIFPIQCHFLSYRISSRYHIHRWYQQCKIYRWNLIRIDNNRFATLQCVQMIETPKNNDAGPRSETMATAETSAFVRHVVDFSACRRPKSRQHDQVDERKILLLKVLLLPL